MKLSKRELIMIIGIVAIVTIAAFWMLLLSPAKDRLAASQAEYQSLQATDDANQLIINNVSSLDSTRTSLKSDIGKIETSLLPELDVEVISEHFASIFEKHGLHFITEISSEPLVTEQLQLTNGTTSPDNLQWVRLKMKVSGTDGVTDGGIPAVGYDEFIAAVKDIEAAEPSAIHVSSLSMEDTNYGFQYFLISVDVFAFNLQNPVTTTNTNEPYITWTRDPVASGGLFGIPYSRLFAANQMTVPFYRPFATVPVEGGSTTAGTNPTPTP